MRGGVLAISEARSEPRVPFVDPIEAHRAEPWPLFLSIGNRECLALSWQVHYNNSDAINK